MKPITQELLQMLSNNDVTFYIPPYQRNYEWDNEQCLVFLEDIIKTARLNLKGQITEHFFGTVTYFQSEPVFGQPDKLVLIDGQQRITTTMLFLIALRDIIADETLKTFVDQKYLKNNNAVGEGEYKIKLKQVETDWESYKKIVLGMPLTNEDKTAAVYHNYKFFCDELRKIIDRKDIELKDLIEKGLAKFPQEFYFLGNLINHYVFGGQPQKATELLDQAISHDPNNAQLYSVRGSMLEVLEDIDGAMANFDKAIELKPDFKEAWLGKARLIYNKAFKMEQKALEIRDFKLSDQEVAKALEVYKESIPFFEKVIELDPEDYETMKTLRGLFYKLTNSDPSYQAKYDEINKKMLGY